MSLRVLSIFGTRPEAVKMAPVIQELARTPGIESRVVITAQHRQMLDQVLDLFEISPEIDLNLMRHDQSLAGLTASIFTHLDPVLKQIQPQWVLIQGDTVTVMATAMLCYYNHIRVGHIEAGLRTGDKWQPFPEEVNRRVASVIADLHFAPTSHSRLNLLKEGIPDWRIVVTGNPVIDALNKIVSLPTPAKARQLLDRHNIHPGGRRLVMVTAHRRENFGAPFEDLCNGLRALAEAYPNDIQIVYPVHLNPNVQEPVKRLLSGISNIALLPPMDYLPMVHMLKHATIVLTDSGGIQEEATSLGVPTLVLRQVTERPEGIEAGVLKLVGTDPTRILQEASRLLDDPAVYQSMAAAKNPFGDGHAAPRIIKALLDYVER